MKVLIICFSGTGNTYFCAKYLKDHLMIAEHKVSIASIEDFDKKEMSKYDILLVGFPVYACNVPETMKNYLKNIPLTAKKICYIFCTKGFYAGNALVNAATLLVNGRYIPRGFADVTMPGSDGLAFLSKNSATANKMQNMDFDHIDPLDHLVAAINDDLANAHPDLMKHRRIKFSGSLAQGFMALLYGPIEKLLKRKFRADEHCVRCGYCAEVCPTKNIEVTESGVHFDDHCILCMRCVHQCPKEAIQIGKLTVGKIRWKGPKGDFHPLKQTDHSDFS